MQPLGRVASLLDSVPTIEPHPERPVQKLEPAIKDAPGAVELDATSPKTIEFESVNFGYMEEQQILHDVSFKVVEGVVGGAAVATAQ